MSNYMEKIEWLFTCLGGFWRWVGFVLFCFIVGVGFVFVFVFDSRATRQAKVLLAGDLYFSSPV